MMKKSNYYVYVLRDGHEIVYYGITHDRERSILQKEHNKKRWTNYSIVQGPFQKECAKLAAKSIISDYQDVHQGKLPRYNL